MSKVVIDMSMSLDGFVAGPDDGKAHPLGRHGGAHVFDWYDSGTEVHHHLPWLRPAPGANSDEVERAFAESGAYIFGRRTYEITDGIIDAQAWRGSRQQSLADEARMSSPPAIPPSWYCAATSNCALS